MAPNHFKFQCNAKTFKLNNFRKRQFTNSKPNSTTHPSTSDKFHSNLFPCFSKKYFSSSFEYKFSSKREFFVLNKEQNNNKCYQISREKFIQK